MFQNILGHLAPGIEYIQLMPPWGLIFLVLYLGVGGYWLFGPTYEASPPAQGAATHNAPPQHESSNKTSTPGVEIPTPFSRFQRAPPRFFTPPPGPNFSHFLMKRKGVRGTHTRTLGTQELSTSSSNKALASTPRSYHTRSPRATTENDILARPDYVSRITTQGPTVYATLKRMGMFDEWGTPTEKMREEYPGLCANVYGEEDEEGKMEEGYGVLNSPTYMRG